jgi:hypothetical protein
VKYLLSYGSIYNFRPEEIVSMGKESLNISSTIPASIEEVIELLEHNSSLKHKDAIEWILGTEEFIEREDWKPWIGQPMFHMIDIKIVPVPDEDSPDH